MQEKYAFPCIVYNWPDFHEPSPVEGSDKEKNRK